MSYSPQDEMSGQRFGEEQHDVDELRHAALESIAAEVLQRFAVESGKKTVRPEVAASQHELETLADLLLSDKETAAQEFIDSVRARGVPIEGIYLSYLAGAARLLGTRWDEDKVTFLDVTAGTVRIYAIMCALSRSFTEQFPIRSRSAVFATVPGETHTLGVSTAADLLTKRGWSISVLTGRSRDNLVDTLAAGDGRILGLSAGGSHAMDSLAKVIVAMRVRLPNMKIVVGGNILAEGRDAVLEMRPDAIASTMPETYAALERFLRNRR